MANAETVDDYLNALPAEVRAGLESLRRAIKAAAPMAEETISYRIPTYKYLGPLVHFMAYKNHCSFITVNRDVIGLFETELRGYKVSGTTIQFEHGKPPPVELVRKIVKARVKQNEEGA